MERSEIKLLLESQPDTAVLKPYRKQANKREIERMDAMMWQALDRNDIDALNETLANGARPKSIRNGIPPIWHCAQAGRSDMVLALMQAGADPSALAKGASIWVAIAPRDNPDEAQTLYEIIGGSVRLDCAELARKGAWRLLSWAASKNGCIQEKWPDYQSVGMGEEAYVWINAALDGPGDIMERLSREWGVSDTRTLEQARGHGCARAAWDQVAIQDNLASAKRLLEHNWLPPVEGNDENVKNYRKPIPVVWQHGMGWVFLSKGAWNLWSWWMKSPIRQAQFQQAMRDHPGQTINEIATNRASLERLFILGVDLDMVDAQGNSTAHSIFASPALTKTMVEWWMDERPEDLERRNNQGRTPLDAKSDKPAILAWARARWMGTQTPGAGAAPTPVQRL